MNDFIVIHKADNVAVVLRPFKKGEKVLDVELLEDVPQAHKVALKDIKKGENIIKYGNPIGHATKDIKKGIMYMFKMLLQTLMMSLIINMSQIIQKY